MAVPGVLVLGVVIASYMIMARNSSAAATEKADCLIRPDTSSFEWLRFASQADALYQAGREAALLALPQLQQDLERAK